MNFKYNLFLDDYRNPQDCLSYMHKRIGADNAVYHGDWVVVKNYKEFTDYIKHNGVPRVVSFDHDLGDEHYLLGCAEFCDWEEYYRADNRQETGYDCAKWLVDYCKNNNLDLPICIVHSMNPVGTENIKRVLNGKIS